MNALRGAAQVWWLSRRLDRDGRLPSLLAVIAFMVGSAALTLTGAGVLAFSRRRATDIDFMYFMLAVTAGVLLVVPCLTLAAQASRLTVARRNAQLAAIRLAGATRGQVTLIGVLEATAQAVVGWVLGMALYLAVLPLVGALPFQGVPFGFAGLVLAPQWWAVSFGVVVVMGVVSSLVSQVRVSITPLGVAQRMTPRRMSVLRVVVAVVLLAVWLGASQILGQLGVGVGLAIVLAVVASINLVGPFVVMVMGRIMASRAKSVTGLLAGRAIEDDPKAVWRITGMAGLAVLLAGLSSMAAGMADQPADDAPYLATDLMSGSLLALAIVAVLAATSVGVTQAARAFDRQREIRTLSFSGMTVDLLLQARRREVMVPLIGTIVMVGGFTGLLLLPFIATAGPLLLLTYLGGVVGVVALVWAGLGASSRLVRDQHRLDAPQLVSAE